MRRPVYSRVFHRLGNGRSEVICDARTADGDFIAHARTDLLAALEALEEAKGRGTLLEKGIRFLLLRITRVEGERNEAIRHEQRFRDDLGRILRGSKEGE